MNATKGLLLSTFSNSLKSLTRMKNYHFKFVYQFSKPQMRQKNSKLLWKVYETQKNYKHKSSRNVHPRKIYAHTTNTLKIYFKKISSMTMEILNFTHINNNPQNFFKKDGEIWNLSFGKSSTSRTWRFEEAQGSN